MVRETFFDQLQYEKRYSSHTIEAYRCDLLQFSDYLKHTYEVENENQVTSVMIRSWLASLIEAGRSARSVNRKLSSLKTYFKYLLRLGLIETNPVRLSSSLRIPERLPSFATKKEMERALNPNTISRNTANRALKNTDTTDRDIKKKNTVNRHTEHRNIEIEDKEDLDTANKHRDNENRDTEITFSKRRDLIVLEVFYSTGIRLAEFDNLLINDIDFYTKTVKVTGKRNKQRIIPVSELLIIKIKDYLAMREKVALLGENHFIINDKGVKAGRVFIYNLVKEYLTLAGVTGSKSPHVLRHTFATQMLNEGADLFAIKELLGHSSLASTQVYTHTNVEKLKSIYKLAHPWAQIKEES